MAISPGVEAKVNMVNLIENLQMRPWISMVGKQEKKARGMEGYRGVCVGGVLILKHETIAKITV